MPSVGETIEEAGYTFIEIENDVGMLVLYNPATEEDEVFQLVENDDCPSWHIVYEGRQYEFCHSNGKVS